MDKPKKMNYSISPIRKILLTEAVSDGSTQKKAAALKGTWIRINEDVFAFVEEAQTTFVFNNENEAGCACEVFNSDPSMNILCEHIIAFEDLKSPPQLSIKSPDCNWLSGYLMSACDWVSRDGYLYPPESKEPEVVAELPAVDPVNEDKPLDIGVGDESHIDEKTYSRKCTHCGEIISGTDLAQVKLDIAEHIRGCPSNPANKKKSPRLVTQVASEQPQEPVVKESSTTKKPTGSETVEKPSKMYDHPDGAKFDTAEELLDYVDALKAEQEMDDTKALMATNTVTDTDQSWTDAQIEVMRKTVAAKATPEEFVYFLNVAKYSGLNPFLKEIYFIKTDKGQTSIITGRDGYLTIAKRDIRFMGVQSMEVCETDVFEMSMSMNDDGAIHQNMTHQITNFKDRGEIIGAWARSQMQGEEPVIIYASMTEYDKSKNPLGGKVWKQYTSSMIRKVAESMVLKRIAGISGLVTEAEIDGTDLVTLDGGE